MPRRHRRAIRHRPAAALIAAGTAQRSNTASNARPTAAATATATAAAGWVVCSSAKGQDCLVEAATILEMVDSDCRRRARGADRHRRNSGAPAEDGRDLDDSEPNCRIYCDGNCGTDGRAHRNSNCRPNERRPSFPSSSLEGEMASSPFLRPTTMNPR